MLLCITHISNFLYLEITLHQKNDANILISKKWTPYLAGDQVAAIVAMQKVSFFFVVFF